VAVGAKQELFRVLVSAARDAGLHLLRITSTQASIANALRFAQPESFGNEVVTIIEFGPRTCAVTAAARGQPALTRVIDLDDATATGAG
jgi:hypothetical protein